MSKRNIGNVSVKLCSMFSRNLRNVSLMVPLLTAQRKLRIREEDPLPYVTLCTTARSLLSCVFPLSLLRVVHTIAAVTPLGTQLFASQFPTS